MGRESHDPTVVVNYSSIALLQERFKQLERVKEMREKRELIRIIADHQPNYKKKHCLYYYDEPTSRLFYNPPDLVFPAQRSSSPPSSQVLSLSLWSTSNNNFHENYTSFETQHLMGSNIVPTSSELSLNFKLLEDSSVYDDHSDLDTSLHL